MGLVISTGAEPRAVGVRDRGRAPRRQQARGLPARRCPRGWGSPARPPCTPGGGPPRGPPARPERPLERAARAAAREPPGGARDTWPRNAARRPRGPSSRAPGGRRCRLAAAVCVARRGCAGARRMGRVRAQTRFAPLAQLDRASASGAEGHWFESSVARPSKQAVSEIAPGKLGAMWGRFKPPEGERAAASVAEGHRFEMEAPNASKTGRCAPGAVGAGGDWGRFNPEPLVASPAAAITLGARCAYRSVTAVDVWPSTSRTSSSRHILPHQPAMSEVAQECRRSCHRTPRPGSAYAACGARRRGRRGGV